jgi:thiol-disulfide isomerase/thioredoxin
MRFVSSCAVRFAAVAVAATLATAASAVEIDQPAPELDLRLLSGKVLKAKDLRGKVVISMVWATWSLAARMELPELERLYQAQREKGLEVVALSIDENVGDVQRFWRKRGYTLPVGMRSDEFFEHYGRASTTPMFYVVDRQGVLRHRIAGPVSQEKLEQLLTPLLAETPPPSRVAKH